MNVGEEKDMKNVPEKNKMVNTSKVRRCECDSDGTDHEYRFYYLGLSHLPTTCETVHMLERVSIKRFFSAYVCCFVLSRLYHTAVWHCGML